MWGTWFQSWKHAFISDLVCNSKVNIIWDALIRQMSLYTITRTSFRGDRTDTQAYTKTLALREQTANGYVVKGSAKRASAAAAQ